MQNYLGYNYKSSKWYEKSPIAIFDKNMKNKKKQIKKKDYFKKFKSLFNMR